MRDNFSQQIKDQLAQRTGYKCSNPFCRRTIIGPQQGSAGTVNIGEAAHIYAAFLEVETNENVFFRQLLLG